MNMQALKSAAERWDNSSGFACSDIMECQDDLLSLSEFAASLLVDAPVTEEWLREKWGFRKANNYSIRISRKLEVEDGYGRRTITLSWHLGILHIDAIFITDVSQGQFAMLAYGLGLKPNEIGDG